MPKTYYASQAPLKLLLDNQRPLPLRHTSIHFLAKCTTSFSMADSSSPFVFLLLLLLPFSLSAAVATAESHEYTAPPEKMTHLHFYFHEKYTSPKATAVLVAVPPGTNATFDTFGALIVIDDILRDGPEESSKLIGRAQGLAAQASLEGTQMLTAVNFVFTEGEYNGSTVAILGRIVPTVSPTERSIVGGSGKFRMARGYTVGNTYSFSDGYFVLELDAYIIHY
ncbi:hypothetical protein B296_00041035 [Ensete ventricosum]|uniref:Dirigent protein n=1 Tax=Ensete ventricosum TaxID=4639 RepID=A0A426ZNE4_ENSVE|nr:hypothetical protein B296_00041035 [Ensete ventricosum]